MWKINFYLTSERSIHQIKSLLLKIISYYRLTYDGFIWAELMLVSYPNHGVNARIYHSAMREKVISNPLNSIRHPTVSAQAYQKSHDITHRLAIFGDNR